MKKFSKINIFACAALALATALCMSSAAFAAGEQDIEPVYPNGAAEEQDITGVHPVEAPVFTAVSEPTASQPYFVDTAPPEKDIAISPAYDPDTDSLPQASSTGKKVHDNPFEGQPMGTGNVDDLLKYWETNGYPDYVSYAGEFGVATYNVLTQTETVYNQWTIGTVNITEAQKQEILSLVSSKYYVDFKAATYSHADREKKAEEIRQSYPKSYVELSEASETIYVSNNGYTEDEWKKIAKEFEGGIVVNGGDYTTTLDSGAGIPEIGILEGEEVGTSPAIKAPEEFDGASTTAGNGNAAPTEGVDGAAPSGGAAPTENEGDETAIVSIEDNGNPAPPIGGDYDEAPAVNDKDGASDAPPVNGEGGNAEIAPEGEADGFSGNQEAAMLPAIQKKADPIYMWIFISGVSIITAATAAFVILHRAKKNAALMITNEGTTVSLSQNPTKTEIVNAVKNSETEPKDDSFQKIMEEINK